MNNWNKLTQYIDPDIQKLQEYSQYNHSPIQSTQFVDPQLIELLAKYGGFRGQLGVHPDTIGRSPAIKLHLEDDSPIKK